MRIELDTIVFFLAAWGDQSLFSESRVASFVGEVDTTVLKPEVVSVKTILQPVGVSSVEYRYCIITYAVCMLRLVAGVYTWTRVF